MKFIFYFYKLEIDYDYHDNHNLTVVSLPVELQQKLLELLSIIFSKSSDSGIQPSLWHCIRSLHLTFRESQYFTKNLRQEVIIQLNYTNFKASNSVAYPITMKCIKTHSSRWMFKIQM